jgi:hypothetical protein
MSYQIGIEAGVEAINRKQPLHELLNGAVQVSRSQSGFEMLVGLSDAMASIFDSFQGKGYRFSTLTTPRGQQIADAAPQARRLHLAALCQRIDQPAADVLADLANAVYSVRDYITRSSIEAVPTETTKPSRVEIVGMPGRVTLMEVQRNHENEIVQTKQTERDA